jgi:hypothetical protein
MGGEYLTVLPVESKMLRFAGLVSKLPLNKVIIALPAINIST